MQAVLWDMDGTIIDSEPLWLASEQAMLARYGIELTAETRDRLVGTGLWDAAARFQELGVPLSADAIVDEWVADVARGIVSGEARWRPGARDLLASLTDAGIPCALVTMSVQALADIVVAQLPPQTFSAIISGDAAHPPKPHPDPYLRGAAALGVAVDACLALEDSPTGLRSAMAAGAVAIGVPHLVSLEDAPAHALWKTLEGHSAASLLEAFQRLRPRVDASRTGAQSAVGSQE